MSAKGQSHKAARAIEARNGSCRIVFETDNDAFAEAPATEVARILSRVSDDIRLNGAGHGVIKDINGNRIGSWQINFPARDIGRTCDPTCAPCENCEHGECDCPCSEVA